MKRIHRCHFTQTFHFSPHSPYFTSLYTCSMLWNQPPHIGLFCSGPCYAPHSFSRTVWMSSGESAPLGCLSVAMAMDQQKLTLGTHSFSPSAVERNLTWCLVLIQHPPVCRGAVCGASRSKYRLCSNTVYVWCKNASEKTAGAVCKQIGLGWKLSFGVIARFLIGQQAYDFISERRLSLITAPQETRLRGLVQ